MRFDLETVQPFSFPTTVCLVDDHADFLNSLSMALDRTLYARTYDSPRKALADIQGGVFRTSLPREGWVYQWSDQYSEATPLLALEIESIHRLIYAPDRFAELSVIVVDYSMPEMDGLAFCEQIDDPRISKILLTGRADERLAVQAFNGGLIDRFILKSDPNVFKQLGREIKKLQRRFFASASEQILRALPPGRYNFLRQPAFNELMRKVAYERRTVEHYVCTMPTGVLMVNAKGVGTFLLVQTEHDVKVQREVAFEQEAPDELLRALASGKWLPWFHQTRGYYTSECAANFERFLFPALSVEDDYSFQYALIDADAAFKLNMINPYDTWLAEQEGSSAARRQSGAPHLVLVKPP